MEVVQHAEAWLTAHPTGPHFVWVHLYDPHDPYEPPAPYSQSYKDHLYDGEIAYADSALAAFVAYLKKNGEYQSALVVVVGDHGEGLGEHHEDTHGIFLYDSTTHVPLIIKLPAGAGAGKVVAAQVRTLDILPTVIDLRGAPSTAKLDGLSLKPYLTGSDKSPRVVLGQTDYPLRFGWAPLRSVRTEGFKLIEAPRPELYNLQSDPGELQNKYEPQSSETQQLRGILAEIPFNPPTPALPDPKDRIDEQSLLHLAMIASEDNRPADARTALEKVLQLDPKSPTALRQLGELELRAGDYAHAAQHLKAALEVRPDDATTAFYEAQALAKTNDLSGARDALEKSLKLVPGQFPARLLLGQVYLGLKDAKAAEDQFEAALLLESNSVEAQLGVARAEILQGRPAEAALQLEVLAKSHPRTLEVFELLSQAYTSLGKTTEAHKAEIRTDQLRKAQR
jgi:choline-sulfatase